jgi:hypothetical protein
MMAQGARGRGRPSFGGVSKPPPKETEPTLAAQGIDKELAKRARAAAQIEAKAFEAKVEKATRLAEAAVSGDGAVLREARAERITERAGRRLSESVSRQCRVPHLDALHYKSVIRL